MTTSAIDFNNTVIKVENVSKVYSMRKKSSVRHKVSTLARSDYDDLQKKRLFYALRDINFSVEKGEGIALFGRNGSGKTTLLQLLANVMSPTTGSITVNGRFTALLGATLGLVRTMTGLENIHLMAAMYGIRLDKEPALLDEIIEFADIGDFIDTYVKNYSSGMKARVGFSVAIHVLPEIVFIDEVLGVGDIHFRKKCTTKIRQLKDEGRTFVIVTQNAKRVDKLCERAIWLNEGELMMDGTLKETWKEYFSFKREFKKRRWYR